MPTDDFEISYNSKEKKYRLYVYILLILCSIFAIIIIILIAGRKVEHTNYEHTYEKINYNNKHMETSKKINCSSNIGSHKSVVTKLDHEICISEECIRTAADILLSLNTSVNPCDDFYRFTCDRWSNQNPSHSTFDKVEEIMIAKSIKFYKSKQEEQEPKAVQQSKDFFKSCSDEETRNELKYKPIFKYLSQLGLPAVPRFFNLTENEDDMKNYTFNFIKTDVEMNKLLNLQLLVDCDVREYILNNTRNVLQFGIPSLKIFGFQGLSLSENHYEMITKSGSNENEDNSIYAKASNARMLYIYFAVKELISEKYPLPDDFETIFLEAMDSVYDIDYVLQEIKGETKYSAQNNYSEITVRALQSYTDTFARALGLEPKEIWKPYLKELFSDVEISIDDNTIIYILPSHKDYYASIAGLLYFETDIKIELWFWWKAVYNMFYHTTTEAEAMFNKIVKTIKDDLNPIREVTCAKLVNNYMQYVVSYALADKSFFTTIKPKIKQLWDSIKDAFLNRINGLTWIDSFTKQLIKEKSNAMTEYIGFPEWILNKTQLESFYFSVTINNDTYLDNLIQMTKFEKIQALKRLNVLNSKKWPHSPLKVNAFNDFLGNKITIPMAIINYPFFDRGLDVLNYGALGTILGHELTHGFDVTGSLFDKHGNFNSLWSTFTVFNFYRRTKCFINQYDQFYINDLENYVNGTITIAENLADNGGLRHAYLAYQKQRKRNPQEIKLPGLEKYTSDQLFFMSYANIWCNQESSVDLKLTSDDVHTPKRYRVLGNLMNSKEFANAFQCEVGSYMNPINKCDLW